MEASRPKFQDTAEHFSDFRRQWKENQKVLRSTFPSIGKTQILSILKTCLDLATALQLHREHEDNSRLSAKGCMAIMERDFGKYVLTQAREEWRSVILHNNGRNLTTKEWRTFQLQLEIAAERVEYKGEREKYEILYNQLSAHWQENLVEERKHRSENQNWVRVAALSNLNRGDLMQLLEEEGI
jgi:hypothetical protein